MKAGDFLVRLEGVEPSSFGYHPNALTVELQADESWTGSIAQPNKFGPGSGDRTRLATLATWHITTMLYPGMNLVAPAGLEPA